MFRVWMVVCVLSITSCVRPDLLPCGDNMCPADSVCLADQDRCVTTIALDACSDKQEVDDCLIGTSTGKCVGGACTIVACGNGIVEPGELCDDGNRSSGDACSFDCRSTEMCGNGYVDFVALEQCDDGNSVDGDACEHDCRLPRCGDHIVNASIGEACDDGNRADGDGCSRDCTSTESCGNGIRDPGEECDDGNVASHDGCQSTCKVQRCGDGIIDIGEQCDDGNFNNNDACLNTCAPATCGDGFVYAGGNEVCDDGNRNQTDGCGNDCQPARCGDGFTWVGHEACDDGNTNQLDCCKNDCSIPPCGDGIVQCTESCDDGNLNDSDTCRLGCTTRCPLEPLGIDASSLYVSGLTTIDPLNGSFTPAIRGPYTAYGGGSYGGIGYGWSGYVTDLSNGTQIPVGEANFANDSTLTNLQYTGGGMFSWDNLVTAAWFGLTTYCSTNGGNGTIVPVMTVSVVTACGTISTAQIWQAAYLGAMSSSSWPVCP
ncbi:MAG: DUF4215 domain-containing protein [Myxococcales bacterium]|nr:DUF4215 domain-containing protein [Myxococcales bacterium]